MNIEDGSSSTASSPKRSRALERRLRLLQSVLPRMLGPIEHTLNAATRYDRGFWSDFLDKCRDMEIVQWRFDLLHDAHSDLVGGVLKGLEEAVEAIEAAQGDIPEEYKTTMFPRLETLTGDVSKASDSSNLRIILAKPNDTDSFIEFLNGLAAVMKNDRDESESPSDIEQMPSKTKPPLAPLISNLFSTLSMKWHCTNACKDSHQAALALFTNRTYAVDNNASVSFTVLLSKPKPQKPIIPWLEAGITVSELLPNSTVRTAVPILKPRESAPVRDLCGFIKKGKSTRINLNVDGSSLFSHGEADVKMPVFTECEPKSLSEAFLEHTAELDFAGKTCLAVVLSFSFLDFCGKPWFPGGWRRNNLYLMQNRNNISLQPFLITDIIPRKSEPSTKATIAIWEAKLLDHGILLMELFQQDTFRRESGKAPPNTKDKAKEWFESINWDQFEPWARAAEACINGTLIESLIASSGVTGQNTAGLLGSQLSTPVENLDEIFFKLFYEAVLLPLEETFTIQWPNQDPDQLISTLKLPRINKNLGSPASRRVRRSSEAKFKAGTFPVPRLPYEQTRPQPWSPTRHSRLGRFNEGSFFDTSDTSDPKETKSALNWFKLFDAIKAKLPAGVAPKKRIKIGVLDTGIDMENTFISQKQGRFRCWPPDGDHHDSDGHGTHVAYLLLRLASHADLRICKVASSRSIGSANIKRIADAITHFSQPGEDHVDILNLSFGFPKYNDTLEPINKAIRNAANSGIIIFAAAGNEGGNAGICWPASLQGRGDVIPINSSDGIGSLSRTTPKLGIGRCIYTLGQGVPSCETQKIDGGPQVIHRSGSSFATPIAAAIAAIILGVMDHAIVSNHSQDLVALRPRLRTRLGMESVLCETCVRGHKGSNNYYLTPWYFFEVGEETQIHVIRKVLMEVTPLSV